MTATYTEARDEMFRLITDTLSPLAAVIVGYAPEFRYQGVEKPDQKPPVDKYYIRLSTKNVSSEQTSFVSDDTPGQTAKEYTNEGLVFVQVFGPMSVTGSFRKAGLIAEAAQKVFQNAETSSSVWFRRARINEVDNDGKYFPFNVIAEYQFGQLN